MNAGRDEAGFTLVEMLVAIALLAIMSAYALGTLTTLSRAGRVEARIEGRSEIEAVQRHFSVTLAGARNVFFPGESGEQKPPFEGSASSLQAVTLLNDQIERGGLYVLRYQADEQQGALLLSYTLLRPAKEQLQPKTEVLLNGVKSVSFRYFGPRVPGGPPEWLESWNSMEGLPARVQVIVTFNDGDSRQWPPLTIPILGSG